MTAETSNARGEWPERYACNGPEGTFWTDDAVLANKLIKAAFDRDEWTVTDTQNPTGAAPPPPADARGEWVLVPRNPTEAMIDAWRDAPNIWEDAYAAMLAAAPQTPSAPVGAQDIAVLRRIRAALPDVGVNGWIEGVRTLDRVLAALAQQPAARPPKPTECMNGCPDRQVCDHCQWPTGPDQQPAAVDEAMVERATTAYLQSRGTYEGEVPVDRDDIRAALIAALAAQHQEPTT